MKDETRKELDSLDKGAVELFIAIEERLEELLNFGRTHFEEEPFVTERANQKAFLPLRLLLRDYMRRLTLMRLCNPTKEEKEALDKKEKADAKMYRGWK